MTFTYGEHRRPQSSQVVPPPEHLCSVPSPLPEPLRVISADCKQTCDFGWLNPRSRWFRALFPDIHGEYQRGDLSHDAAMDEARKSLHRLIACIFRSSGVRDHTVAEDATQVLILRISLLYARKKYRKRQGTVMAFVAGVRRNVASETLRKRVRQHTALFDTETGGGALASQLDVMLHQELIGVLGNLFAEESELRRQSLARKHGSMYQTRAPQEKVHNESVNRSRGVEALRTRLEQLGLIEPSRRQGSNSKSSPERERTRLWPST